MTLSERPAFFNPLDGVVELFLADRQARHPQTTLARGIFGEPAPAAADFQHMIARLGAHLVDHAGVFLFLRLFQAFLPAVEPAEE